MQAGETSLSAFTDQVLTDSNIYIIYPVIWYLIDHLKLKRSHDNSVLPPSTTRKDVGCYRYCRVLEFCTPIYIPTTQNSHAYIHELYTKTKTQLWRDKMIEPRESACWPKTTSHSGVSVWATEDVSCTEIS